MSDTHKPDQASGEWSFVYTRIGDDTLSETAFVPLEHAEAKINSLRAERERLRAENIAHLILIEGQVEQVAKLRGELEKIAYGTLKEFEWVSIAREVLEKYGREK